MCRCTSYCAASCRQLAVRVTSSSSSSSGTKPLPPHVGHCRSSSVPFSMTPSPLQSGQVLVFTCASLWSSCEPNPPTQRNAPGKHRQLSDVGQFGRYEIEDVRFRG